MEHEHEWLDHKPLDRYICKICGVLGYRSGMGFGKGKIRRKIFPYKCHTSGCHDLAKYRTYRGTVEIFLCAECAEYANMKKGVK